ncbi:MAG: XRE family transcriptional regulator [Nitrospirae bacterium]|nr:XRE family transcriptional regulator [Nitrospirota bacterium]
MDKVINPDMIIIARESRGLTQTKLASLLSISQGIISKIESGVSSINKDMLKKLSEQLDYPEHFFLIPDPIYGFGMSLVYHRKRQSISNKIIAKIHAQINIKRIHISKLLHAVDVETCKIPKLDIDEHNGNVEDIARAIRASWSLPLGPIKNLTKSIEDAGGIVVPCNFETRLLDAVSQWTDGLPPLFFINTNVSGDRLRFTLAHELGHVIMHRSPNRDMEKEADRFAAELLMPRREIRSVFNTVSLPMLANLKPYWKVSMAALLFRASEVGKISDRMKRHLWMQMGQAGYRKCEPRELDIPIEEPTLLKELFDTYEKELNYNLSELSHLLAIHAHELRYMYFGQRSHLRLVS